MSRRKRMFGTDEYLLPSERYELKHSEEDDDVFAGSDDLEIADKIARELPQNADELIHKAAMRRHKWKSLDQTAPFTRIQPPTVLQGVIGGQQSVVPSGPALEVANWGGEDAETLPVSVVFAPVDPPNVSQTLSEFFPYGIVKFGTRGMLITVEVDIGRGVQFTVPASSVVLQVGLGPDPGNFNQPMRLSGMLSFFPVLKTPEVTRSFFQGGLGSGNSSPLFTVPIYARDLRFVQSSAPATTYSIDFLESDGTIAYTVNVVSGANILDPIPLTTDIFFIRINNTGGNSSQNSRLIFGLGL